MCVCWAHTQTHTHTCRISTRSPSQVFPPLVFLRALGRKRRKCRRWNAENNTLEIGSPYISGALNKILAIRFLLWHKFKSLIMASLNRNDMVIFTSTKMTNFTLVWVKWNQFNLIYIPFDKLYNKNLYSKIKCYISVFYLLFLVGQK